MARFLPALLVAAALVCGVPAHAGLEEGEAAFKRRDFAAALAEFQSLADAGDATAQFYVGTMYLAGLGVARDDFKAADYYGRAAEQGNGKAAAALGQLYLQGRGVAKDEAKGVALTEQAAKAGVPSAQVTLGILIAAGRGGYERNPETAFAWFKAAADQGYVRAYSWVGNAYDRGHGVAQDEAQAVEWWRKGAEARDRDCRFYLARAYIAGKGGLGRDVKTGVALLKQAANQGHAGSQALLGVMYDRGIGIPADYVLAYMWLNLARSQGLTSESLRETLEGLEKKMSPEQIAEAQRRSRQWRAVADAADAAARKTPSAAGTSSGTSSGSGFVVSTAGHLVTNHHVVASCRRVTLMPGGTEAEVLARDPHNDLALLKADLTDWRVARMRAGSSVRPGDEVVVVGYPLRSLLGGGTVVTTGTVSALGGMSNDSSKLQIAAPVQQGSSGGPLLDRHGLVVGVVQSKINALRIAAHTGDIPQNVNFAINGATLASFLAAHNVPFQATAPARGELSAADVGQAASQFTLAVECHR